MKEKLLEKWVLLIDEGFMIICIFYFIYIFTSYLICGSAVYHPARPPPQMHLHPPARTRNELSFVPRPAGVQTSTLYVVVLRR